MTSRALVHRHGLYCVGRADTTDIIVISVCSGIIGSVITDGVTFILRVFAILGMT